MIHTNIEECLPNLLHTPRRYPPQVPRFQEEADQAVKAIHNCIESKTKQSNMQKLGNTYTEISNVDNKRNGCLIMTIQQKKNCITKRKS